MSRTQQDQFIDDEEEETCPLCVEEFDLSDKAFRPCPCGYQVCQFCYHNVRTNMNGLCPACRRPYDDSTIEFRKPSADDEAAWKARQALKQRKSAAAQQKEALKREADTLSRKHLAGLRVVQKNLVYVTGLSPSIQEDRLLETLRTQQYFGQYGKIVKIVVSKAKDHLYPQSVGVYVTYTRKEDAASCIEAVDGSENGERTLRAQYGTTKYCSAYLRHEQCQNRQCMFLHEPGEDKDSYTRQDLSSWNISSTQSAGIDNPQQPPPQSQQPVAAAHSTAPPLHSLDEGARPALPSTASWASKPFATGSDRSPSHSPDIAAPITHQTPAQESSSRVAHSTMAEVTPPQQFDTATVQTIPTRPTPMPTAFSQLMKTFTSSNFGFVFSTASLSQEDLEAVRNYPPLFDSQGGARRRLQRQREAAEQDRVRADQRLSLADHSESNDRAGSQQPSNDAESQNMPSGSRHMPQSAQQFGLDSIGGLGNDMSSLSLGNRAMTPQQQQQLLLQRFKSSSLQSSRDDSQPIFDGTQQASNTQHKSGNSRFTFANDNGSASTAVKPVANAKAMNQQASMMPQPAHGQQPFFASNVSGPPPGLKPTVTPLFGGRGMFGQGQLGSHPPGYGPFGGRSVESDAVHTDFTKRANASPVQNPIGPKQIQGASDQLVTLSMLGQGQGGSAVAPLATRDKTANRAIRWEQIAPTSQTLTGTAVLASKPTEPDNTKATKGSTSTLQSASQKTVVIKSSSANSTNDQNPSDSSTRAPSIKPGPDQNKTGRSVPVAKSVLATTGLVAESGDGLGQQVTSQSTSTITPAVKSMDTKKATLSAHKPFEKDKTILSPLAQTSPQKRPGMIDLSSANAKLVGRIATSAAPSPSRDNTFAAALSKNASPLTSRPASPSPIDRRPAPRTLRVLATPRTETPPPFPSAAAIVAAASKPLSRKASVSTSLTQPETPMSEHVSDTISLTSGPTVSRASSPPLANAIVGAAPVRTKTKSQLRKERQERSKGFEEDRKETPAEAPVEAVQEAISGRKKKTKKPSAAPRIKANANVPASAATTRPSSPVNEPPAPEVKPVVEEKKVPIYQDALAMQDDSEQIDQGPSEEELAKTIFNDLMAKDPMLSGCVEAFFRTPAQAATHYKPTQAVTTPDVDHERALRRKPEIVLTPEQLDAMASAAKALHYGGEQARVWTRGCVSPKGAHLRHLESELEERYLQLEKAFAANPHDLRFCDDGSYPEVENETEQSKESFASLVRETAKLLPRIDIEATRKGFAATRSDVSHDDDKPQSPSNPAPHARESNAMEKAVDEGSKKGSFLVGNADQYVNEFVMPVAPAAPGVLGADAQAQRGEKNAEPIPDGIESETTTGAPARGDATARSPPAAGPERLERLIADAKKHAEEKESHLRRLIKRNKKLLGLA